MPKKIIFDKYLKRRPDYHWQQVSRNIFGYNAYVAARYRQVADTVAAKDGQRILDIGCGDGVLLGQITKGKLYGIDFDADSVKVAAAKVKGSFSVGAAESLPLKSNYFDTVIATEIIEHLAKPELMLQEIKRVLKSGGRVIITTPVKPADGLTDKLHQREFTPRELKALMAGYFRQIKITTSHASWFKKIYTYSLGRLGRYYLDVGRWLINTWVILTGRNPFLWLPGRPTQQLVTAKK